METLLTEIVRTTGAYGLWVLFGAAMVEYVFPPFPGDTVTLFGAYYAVAGVLSIPLVFAAVTLGSLAGSVINYLVGLHLRGVASRSDRPRPWYARWVSMAKVASIEKTWERRGDLMILGNRFLPGIRGLFFIAAGMAGMPFARVVGLGLISASLWNALLLMVGYLLGANLERLLALFRTYSVIAWTGIVVVAAFLIIRWAYRFRKRRVVEWDRK